MQAADDIPAQVQAILDAAASRNGGVRRLRVSPAVYARLAAHFAGFHSESPTGPLRQLSTRYGLLEVVVDEHVWIAADSG